MVPGVRPVATWPEDLPSKGRLVCRSARDGVECPARLLALRRPIL